jgi:hypothetical protein
MWSDAKKYFTPQTYKRMPRMIKRLANFLLLVGILSLVMFFTSNTYLLDADWFFLGGLGSVFLGILLKRARKGRRARQKEKRRAREAEDDLSS